MKSSPKGTTAGDRQSPNPKSANLKSLRARLTLSFLGVIVATAGLVVVMATLITANRFPYII